MGKSAMHRLLGATALALGTFASALQAAPQCGVDYSVNALTDAPQFQQFYGMDVTLRQNGRPVIAFYGRAADDPGTQSLFVHHCLDRACSPGLTRRLFTSSFVSGRPRIFMQPNGHPVVVNSDHVSVNVFACTDEMCNGGANHSITPPSSGTDMMDAAQRGDGRLVMVYFEQVQKQLRLVTCADSACTDFDDVAVVEAFDADVVIPVLSVGPDERPIVALTHYVLGAGTVAFDVLACDTAACATPVRTQLGDDIAFFVGIAIRSDGRPVIHELYNSDHGMVRKLHYCDDVSCTTSTNHVLPPDFTYDPTRGVVVGPDDLPMLPISGNDWGYLRCSDKDCTAVERVVVGQTATPGVEAIASPPSAQPTIVQLDLGANEIYAAVCSPDDIHGNGNEDTLDLAPVFGE